jgi:3',5'-cyclic-AMP phosphodiesterase
MKIRSKQLTLLHSFRALNAAKGGGRTETKELPLLHGQVELPGGTGLEAVLVLSDMQCYEPTPRVGQARRLMSHALVEALAEWGEQGHIPSPASTGVILAGDLHAEANLIDRGGVGDVQDVWLHFADRFRWVAGVAGNHDLFNGEARFPDSFDALDNVFALHGRSVAVDGLNLAGFSGIAGNSRKPWRNSDRETERAIAELLVHKPDVLILHQGPEENGHLSLDNVVGTTLDEYGSRLPLLVFGHRHWAEPLNQRGETTLLSADSRIVLLTRAGTVGPIPSATV